MKRDWDVIRKILITVEDVPSQDTQIDSDQIEGVDSDVAAYNMRLLLKEGLIEGGGRLESMPGASPWIFATRLTWEGHELLDSIRRDTVWNRVKSTVADKGLDLSVDVVKAVARAVIEAMLKGP
jgi:hypothetical protein